MQGYGNGSVDRVKPKILNGVVKRENLSPEVESRVFFVPQKDVGDNNYTLSLEDSGKHVYATDNTITVPYYYDVDFDIGTEIMIVAGGSSVVIERDGDSTTIWFGTDDYGSYTLGARGVAHLLKTGEEEWYLYGSNITSND